MEQKQLFKVRDKRNKGWFWIENEYFNGFGKILGANAIAVYVCLCRHADQDQKCFPSQKEIGKELMLSSRTVLRIIKSFQKHRIIEIEKNKDNKGKWLHNTYWLLDNTEWIYPSDTRSLGKPSDKTDINQVTHVHTNKTHINNTNILTSKKKNEILTFRGQRARVYFGTYQVWSGGKWTDLDPKYIKEIKGQLN